ncbi:MAG: hypothetical protein WCA59_17160 [Candidatus Binataceae bacterium]
MEARLHEAVAQPDRPTAREADSARRPTRGRVGAWRAATAVMAAGIVGMAIYAGQIRDRLRRANGNHQQEIAAMDSRIASMRAELTRARVEVGTLQRVLGDRIRLEKVLSAPDLRLTRLAPLAPAPGAGAIVAVSATNKAAVFQAAGLPGHAAGQDLRVVVDHQGARAGRGRTVPG